MNASRLLCPGFFAMLGASVALADGFRYVSDSAVPPIDPKTYVRGGQRLQFIADGRLLLSGAFTEVNGNPAPGLMRLQSDGAVDGGFFPDPEFPVERAWYGPMLANPDGRVYFGTSDPWNLSQEIRRLGRDGTLDSNYIVAATMDLGVEGVVVGVTKLVQGTGGRMLVLGQFSRLGGIETVHIGLLGEDGRVDEGFRFSLDRVLSVEHALPLSDGRWIVVLRRRDGESPYPYPGSFEVYRILASGAVDPTYTVHRFDNAAGDPPHAFALDSGGRVVFAEQVTWREGESYRLRLGRLKFDGGRDASFHPVLPEVRMDFSNLAVWLPPQVRQIAPLDGGALLCVGPWEDLSWKGVVRVGSGGGLSKSSLPGSGDDVVLWLARDGERRWWSELARARGAGRETQVVRLRNSGGVDAAFSVHTRAPGEVSKVFAQHNGLVAIQGSFDEIRSEPVPGVAVLDSDGSLRFVDALQSLRWPRSQIVSILSDDSMVVQRTPEPVFATAGGARMETADTTVAAYSPGGSPSIARVFSNGDVRTVLDDGPGWERAAAGWLDDEGRLHLMIPGGSSIGPAKSDIVRFRMNGTVDPSYRALDAAGGTIYTQAACATPEGDGAWVLAPNNGRHRLYRLDDDGRTTVAYDLDLTVPGETWGGSVRAIAAVPGGVVVGGEFQKLNQTPASGLAFLDESGSVPADWGGWLLPGSQVMSVRALENGLLDVAGRLVTPQGELPGTYLRTDGLPEFNAPGYDELSAGTGAPSASPNGSWIAQLGDAVDFSSQGVRRWRSVPSPDPLVEVPGEPVSEGEWVHAQVLWTGVPAVITWWRDGVEVAGATGPTWSFVAGADDDGIVFAARLQFEDGSTMFARPWRLNVVPKGPCLVNGSIRAVGGGDDATLIVGAVVSGNARGSLLARGLGPALGDFGVVGAVSALHIKLVRPDGTGVLPREEYQEWRDYVQESHPDVIAAARKVGAYYPNLGLRSGNDQMLHTLLRPGVYHLHISPRLEVAPGLMLGELYSVDRNAGARRDLWLLNLSGRARIAAGDNVLVGGFVVSGEGSLRLLIRGVGPSLSGYGVEGVSGDPKVTVHSGSAIVGANDDWSATADNQREVSEASAKVGAFPLAVGTRDSALVVELTAGVYSAVLAPAAEGDGIALLEIYAMP